MPAMDTTTPLPPADGSPGYRPPPFGSRRLTRSNDDRMISGVCGGFADYVGLDPTVVRIGTIVLACFGVGIVAYLVGWALIPEADQPPGQPWSTDWLVPASLLVLFLLFGFFELFDGDFDFPGLALVLLGIGAVLVWGRRRDGNRGNRGGPGDGGDGGDGGDPQVVAPPSTPSASSGSTTAMSLLPPPPPPPPAAAPGPAPAAPPPDRARRRRQFPWRSLAMAIGGLFIAGGVVLSAVVLSGELAPTVVLGGGLACLGAFMVAGAWLGIATRPLVPAGLLLLLGLATVAIVDVPLEGGFADRTIVPESAAAIPTEERLTGGKLVIDMRGLELTGDERLLEASVAAGELVVLVPAGTTVEVRAEVGAGELDVLGQERNGVHAELDQVIDGPTGDRIELDLQVGVGRLEVSRG
jgi:phage shock protein PspC (stress-responsive transcriptional regulator)